VAFTFHNNEPAGEYYIEVGVGGDLHRIYHKTLTLW
jgi:hypothetical protein